MNAVQDASKSVISSTEWATVALVSVAAVAIIALATAVAALHRSPTCP